MIQPCDVDIFSCDRRKISMFEALVVDEFIVGMKISMLEALDVDEFVAGGKISMFEAIGVDEITAGGNYLAVIKKGIR